MHNVASVARPMHAAEPVVASAANDLGDTAALALDRASFEHLRVHTSLCGVEDIQAAIERADHEGAAIRALARAWLGLELAPGLVADVLVGVERVDVFLALARRCSADVLLELWRQSRLADNPTGIEQTLCIAFAHCQEPALAARAAIVPLLRHVVQQSWLPARATVLLAWLAQQVGDPDLAIRCEALHSGVANEISSGIGASMQALWNAAIEDVVARLPERAAQRLPPTPIARADRSAGRNDPCPCGSGKKLKRCCSAAGAAATRSASVRVTQLQVLEPHLQPAQVAQLSRADLARLDLTRLRSRALVCVIERQGELRDWRRACLAIAELSHRRGRAAADEHLQGLIYHATRARRYDVARQLLAQLERPELAPDLELEVVLAERGPDALARLESAARVALHEHGLLSTMDVAHAALRTSPALGILLARGSLLDGSSTDAEALLEGIAETRSTMGLTLPDPAHDVFSLLSEVHGQRSETARVTTEHAQRATTNAGSSGDLAAERQRDALRRRIDGLQALLRERNAERAHLRRQLERAAPAAEADTTATQPRPALRAEADLAMDSDADDELLHALPEQMEARRVLVPRFAPSAAASIAAAPRHIAASAVRTAGLLAAGDRAAWDRVKQAKDMPRPVLMTRIGIHHRLLFRTADESLDVLDLVARKDLLLVLKRLRCGER